MTTTLTVTLPDGKKATRETNYDYTHVVCVKDADGWDALSWHSTDSSAQKKAKSARRWKIYEGPLFSQVLVLHVDLPKEKHNEMIEQLRKREAIEYRGWILRINEPECSDFIAMKDKQGTPYGFILYAPTADDMIRCVDAMENTEATK